MKIGILTLPLHTNYGGILQAYALQTVLERMGHEVVVFNKKREFKLPFWKYPLAYIKRATKKYILKKKNVRIFEEQYRKSIYPIISQHTQEFLDKYIHLYNIKTLKNAKEEDFDAIVVGSDQVWRPKYFMPMFKTGIQDAYLAFAKDWNIKRIVYAASFGTDDWEYTTTQTNECRELLKLFDAVSVREESGVELCKEYFGVEVKHVLDPTLLLSKKDYIQLFETAKIPKSSGNLLTYILDETPEKTEIINKIAIDKDLIPFSVNSTKIENPNAPSEERIQPPVEAWLRGFYDAEFIVTDSFHACVFSIIFEKPFIVIGNKKRGMARFESLLKMFGLEDRLFSNIKNYHYIENASNIQAIIEKNRNMAYDFLYKNLKNA